MTALATSLATPSSEPIESGRDSVCMAKRLRVVVPIERYAGGPVPTFAAVWLRDVPFDGETER